MEKCFFILADKSVSAYDFVAQHIKTIIIFNALKP